MKKINFNTITIIGPLRSELREKIESNTHNILVSGIYNKVLNSIAPFYQVQVIISIDIDMITFKENGI